MKYYIITYGCQMNDSDSERIASLLKKQGHQPAKNESQADLIVINVCSVRQSAVDRVYAKVNKYFEKDRWRKKTERSALARGAEPHTEDQRSSGVRVILAGCVLEADKKKLKDKVSEFWHPNHYFECPPLYQSEATAYVPIMTGCNNFCSYCVVPYTRGREKSRPADEIIKEVKSLIKKGYKDIVLLGQNVNSYKSEIRNPKSEKISQFLNFLISKTIKFSDLLKMINDIPGHFGLSFLTSHPKDMSDELIEIMAQCKKLIKELHLPVQSGDNQILKKMNRHYTAAHYKNLIKKIRKAIPGIKISTDIIVGFPSETKKQFQNTVKLCQKIKFDKAYIAKYSPRPGTAACRLKDDVSPQEKKRRWKILEMLINKSHYVKAK